VKTRRGARATCDGRPQERAWKRPSAQLAIFYDHGIGVKADPDAALDWYRLAYRRGDRSVANNIGCILRDRKKLGQAIGWFRRAIQQNDGDASLNIAKIYLHKGDLVRTRSYLDKARRSPWATEQSKEEARSLLRKMKSKSYNLRFSLKEAQL
jgi:TPR repeat protein